MSSGTWITQVNRLSFFTYTIVVTMSQSYETLRVKFSIKLFSRKMHPYSASKNWLPWRITKCFGTQLNLICCTSENYEQLRESNLGPPTMFKRLTIAEPLCQGLNIETIYSLEKTFRNWTGWTQVEFQPTWSDRMIRVRHNNSKDRSRETLGKLWRPDIKSNDQWPECYCIKDQT